MNKPYVNKIENRRQVNAFVLLFVITYMISYITRINYGAIISEMQSATGFSKSLLSMSLTGSFITYGAGQIISGICGDKISPKKLVLYGLVTTVIMNILIPICKTPQQMLAVWSVNGFAQSFMWPPIVKIMTAILSEADYKSAVTKVSWGGNIGTMVVYMISPLLISLFGWKSVFISSAVMGAVMIVVWQRFSYDVKPMPRSEKDIKRKGNVLFAPIMLAVMLAIILQGMLRDGLSTWMPSYVAETYNLSNNASILTGAVLPVFSIICLQIARKIYTNAIKNPLYCAGALFAVGAISAVGLSVFTGHSAGVSVFSFAVLSGCMHGVNLMLICMIPPFFQNTGNVSTVSGVLNSCTYIGSAISTYGIAVLSEMFGWDFTILVWLAVAVIGTVICLVCGKFWNRYKNTLT